MAWQFHPKVTAATFAGALTTIIVAEAQRRGYQIDGTEGASITVILTVLAGIAYPADDVPANPEPAPPGPAP